MKPYTPTNLLRGFVVWEFTGLNGGGFIVSEDVSNLMDCGEQWFYPCNRSTNANNTTRGIHGGGFKRAQ